jgi:hypothetical protein
MPEKEIEHEDFCCPRMGSSVRITREILIHRDSVTRKIDNRGVLSFDCDSKAECGVGTRSGSSITYDWSRCVHPRRS